MSRSTYTTANGSDIVSRVVIPSVDDRVTPPSCVRVTLKAPIKAGINNGVSYGSRVQSFKRNVVFTDEDDLGRFNFEFY